MTVTRMAPIALMLAALGACNSTLDPAGGNTSRTRASLAEAPPGAPPGSCWQKEITPAVIETITRQVMVEPPRPAAGEQPAAPAVFRTETSQEIVQPRRKTWIETPCPPVMTPEFIASLQRALAARGHYTGPVSGRMDAATQAAVRRYQQPGGLDSGTLSLAAARKLGLIAVERPAPPPEG